MYEDAIPSEVKELKASMKKAKTAHEKLRAQTRLSRLQETLRRHTDRKLEQEVSLPSLDTNLTFHTPAGLCLLYHPLCM